MKIQTILVKYGGNAMTDTYSEERAFSEIVRLHRAGHHVVVVHGGGPFIASLLEEARVDTEFVHGHRKTDAQTARYVEMALSGEVNGRVVSALNARGIRSVGLSGKDARMVHLSRRHPLIQTDSGIEHIDIGFVGDVTDVDISLPKLLLTNDMLPVISPVSMSEDGQTFNINADMFAGHLAGALSVDSYIVLTDVDGIRRDVTDSESRIPALTLSAAQDLLEGITGGMIPKLTSCITALEHGASTARIMKGDRDLLLDAGQEKGTTISKH